MASILIMSEKGRMIPIASKLQVEGHIVKVWVKHGHTETLKGIRNPSRVQHPLKLLEQYDLILSESSLLVEEAQVREMGRAVMGCNRVVGKLMYDQEYREKALEFLSVKKPDLEGIRVRCTGWMSPSGFSCATLSFPAYRMLERSKGKLTEGMGSLLVFPQGESRLYALLQSFGELLMKAKYIGPFTLCLEVKGDLWTIKSIDSCFMPEDTLAASELLRCSLFEFLFALQADGKEGKAWDGVALSTTVSIPPWPYALPETLSDAHYVEVPEAARKHFSLGDPSYGILGIATSRGEDVREARRRVYRTVGNSVTSNECQFREDIGLEAEKDLITMKEWGWLI